MKFLLRDTTGIKGKDWEKLQGGEVEDERVKDTRGAWEGCEWRCDCARIGA